MQRKPNRSLSIRRSTSEHNSSVQEYQKQKTTEQERSFHTSINSSPPAQHNTGHSDVVAAFHRRQKIPDLSSCPISEERKKKRSSLLKITGNKIQIRSRGGASKTQFNSDLAKPKLSSKSSNNNLRPGLNFQYFFLCERPNFQILIRADHLVGRFCFKTKSNRLLN